MIMASGGFKTESDSVETDVVVEDFDDNSEYDYESCTSEPETDSAPEDSPDLQTKQSAKFEEVWRPQHVEAQFKECIEFMPPELKYDNFEIILLYNKEDREQAIHFQRQVESYCTVKVAGVGHKPKVMLEEDFVLNNDPVMRWDEIYEKALYVFLFVTKLFCKKHSSDLFKGHSFLMKSLKDKKYRVVPIYSENEEIRHIKGYDLPMALAALRGIDLWDENFFLMAVQKLLETNLWMFLQMNIKLERNRRSYFATNKEFLLQEHAKRYRQFRPSESSVSTKRFPLQEQCAVPDNGGTSSSESTINTMSCSGKSLEHSLAPKECPDSGICSLPASPKIHTHIVSAASIPLHNSTTLSGRNTATSTLSFYQGLHNTVELKKFSDGVEIDSPSAKCQPQTQPIVQLLLAESSKMELGSKDPSFAPVCPQETISPAETKPNAVHGSASITSKNATAKLAPTFVHHHHHHYHKHNVQYAKYLSLGNITKNNHTIGESTSAEDSSDSCDDGKSDQDPTEIKSFSDGDDGQDVKETEYTKEIRH